MLTAKQQRFVEAYAANPNGAQAAIRAGYSARTARVIASENLRKPEIAAAINKATERRQARESIWIERLREELAKIAFADATGIFDEDGRIREPSQWPDELKRVVNYSKWERVRRNRNGDETARVVTRLKVQILGRLKALQMLGESLGMFPRRSTKR
ncbi:MAG: terminase small subunit [Stellaceae bacterium]